MELVEMYLHSREIQRKIAAATKPKRSSQMFMGLQPPPEPQQGDMYLDLSSSPGYAVSTLRMYDEQRKEWLIVNSAVDMGANDATVPRDRRPQIYGRSAAQVVIDDLHELNMLNTSIAAEAIARAAQPQWLVQLPDATPDDIEEFRRALQEPAPILINSGHMTLQRIGEDPIEIPVRNAQLRTAIAPELLADAQATRTRRLEGTINVDSAQFDAGWLRRLTTAIFGG